MFLYDELSRSVVNRLVPIVCGPPADCVKRILSFLNRASTVSPSGTHSIDALLPCSNEYVCASEACNTTEIEIILTLSQI